MSTKASKRRPKRGSTHDEEVEPDKPKDVEPKDPEPEAPKDMNGDSPPVTVEATDDSVVIVDDTTADIKPPTPVVIIDDPEPKTNGEEIETVEVTLNSQISVTDSQKDDTESELILDSDDPELQFPSESDASEVDRSPTLNRCITRRSHTRNIPTPKTPRSPKVDGEEEAEKTVDSTLEASFDSAELDNVSIIANYSGNDTTRNLDITPQIEAPETSFVESAKDKSYHDIVRSLTGRRMLRPHADTHYSHFTHQHVTDGRRYSPVNARKRKVVADCADDAKRFKDDPSPSLISYISSPLHSFRSRFSRSELPTSSTPKLTAFKYTHRASAVDELTKGDDKDVEPKKWCTIM